MIQSKCLAAASILLVGSTIGVTQAATLRGIGGGDVTRDLQEDYSALYTGGLSLKGTTMSKQPDSEPVALSPQEESRIVNGESVTDPTTSTFFTMILRTRGNELRYAGCGASLISNCHVLTVAHCVEGNREGISSHIMAGAFAPYDGFEANRGHPFFSSSIKKVDWHPSYHDRTNRHDMALITFDRCMNAAEMNVVRPVQIAGPDFVHRSGEDVTVYGFGKTSEDQVIDPALGYYTELLQQITVPFIPYDQCDSMLGSGFTVYDDMFCAGGGNKDACQADSGSPAVVMRNGEPVQIGAVSWGVGCARMGKPGVYSSVMAHYDWIHKIVCGDSRTDQDLRICGGLGPVFSQEETESCIEQYRPCDTIGGPTCCEGTSCEVVPFTSGDRICIGL